MIQIAALQRNALPKATVWALRLFSFENKQIHIAGNSWSKFPRQQSTIGGKGQLLGPGMEKAEWPSAPSPSEHTVPARTPEQPQSSRDI